MGASFSADAIDFFLPKDFGEMNDEELCLWYNEKAKAQNITEAKVKFFVKLSGLKAIDTKDGFVYLKNDNVVIKAKEEQFGAVVASMEFLDTQPIRPTRVSRIGEHNAASAMLFELPFGTWLEIENYYQAFLMRKELPILDNIINALYGEGTTLVLQLDKNVGLSLDGARLMIVDWVASIKEEFSRRFDELYQPAIQKDKTPDMMAIMNAQIRALTGGDVTKEEKVRSIGVWRALEELNQKTREAREFNAKMK